ncbi:MAG: hypothetical protein O8C67_05000 [Candidatus Methanoperedens sp.]|nr:hypothetical protein [Candidatus Methanoperedens sp.]
MNKEETIEMSSPTIEMLPNISSFRQSAQTNRSTPLNLPFNDPISTLLMLPILPLFMLVSNIQSMFGQFNNSSSANAPAPQGKVTQIIRDNNALTIVEKYL